MRLVHVPATPPFRRPLQGGPGGSFVHFAMPLEFNPACAGIAQRPEKAPFYSAEGASRARRRARRQAATPYPAQPPEMAAVSGVGAAEPRFS